MRPVTVLILPGLGNSGPGHWQSIWETEHGYQRVAQSDWERPKLGDWLANLDRAVANTNGAVVLVAHSLACALVAHFARSRPEKVLGAFLVCPADVETERCTPHETRCFSPLPLNPLPFPALVVASSDDPYVDRERAEFFAHSWHAEYANIGCAGHINASSGLGAWPEGHARFQACLERWSGPPAAFRAPP